MFCWPGTPHHLKQEFYLESTGPKCQFRFGKRYWGDLKLLYNKSWNFDFSVLYDPLKVVNFGKFCQNIAIFEPKFHIKILSPPTKINLEIWKLACMTYRCVSKTKSAFLEIFIFFDSYGASNPKKLAKNSKYINILTSNPWNVKKSKFQIKLN